MSQTVTTVQAPAIRGRIDGHTNYASWKFVVANGVTVNAGDFVYLTSGTISNATISGDSRPIGFCEETKTGNAGGTVTALVCIDPMMTYLLKGSSAFSTSNVGQYFDLQGAGGAQLVNQGSASSTTGLMLCLAIGAQTTDTAQINDIQGVNTTLYGIFKLVETALSPLGS